MKRLSILFAAVAAFVGVNAYSQEKIAIDQLPYIQNLGETEVTIIWRTNLESTGWVEIAPDDGTNFYAELRPQYYDSQLGFKKVCKLHRVTVPGLEPGKTYRYRVISQEAAASDNGKVVYGHDGNAGELGHTCAVRYNGRPCGCGKTGCLETYCSAMGVARSAREALELSDEPSLLRGVEEISSKTVYEAAVEGDALARRIFEYTGTMLGRSFADFVAFSAPEAIVLFGGLAKAREFFYDAMVNAMNENLMRQWKGKVKIVFSQLKESDAAILGASALAWEL